MVIDRDLDWEGLARGHFADVFYGSSRDWRLGRLLTWAARRAR